MKISVIGIGYVGLVTGACFAEMGNDVICLDVDHQKVEDLRNGKIPIYEPGLEEIVVRNAREHRLDFTTSYQKAVENSDLIFIAVGTPTGEDGHADLKYVLNAAEGIGEYMKTYKTVINKSTVPVGSGKLVKKTIQKILDAREQSLTFDIVSNPEFLKEGSAIEDFMKPDRIIIGVETERARENMVRLYEPFATNGHPILIMDIASSEMTKYAANALLACKISFINEISQICEKLGVNIDSVRKGIGSDTRIGYEFIYAGLGYGGSCFPKDVRALVNMGQGLDEPMDILNSVEKVNKRQREIFVRKVLSFFDGNISGKRIAVWGLAFKPGTDDIREAPSLDILSALLAAGADIYAYDPVAATNVRRHFSGHDRLFFVKDLYEALDQAEALCLLTEWKAFREPDFERMKRHMAAPVIFDGRNQYEPKNMNLLGFTYYSIGRPLEKVQVDAN